MLLSSLCVSLLLTSAAVWECIYIFCCWKRKIESSSLRSLAVKCIFVCVCVVVPGSYTRRSGQSTTHTEKLEQLMGYVNAIPMDTYGKEFRQTRSHLAYSLPTNSLLRSVCSIYIQLKSGHLTCTIKVSDKINLYVYMFLYIVDILWIYFSQLYESSIGFYEINDYTQTFSLELFFFANLSLFFIFIFLSSSLFSSLRARSLKRSIVSENGTRQCRIEWCTRYSWPMSQHKRGLLCRMHTETMGKSQNIVISFFFSSFYFLSFDYFTFFIFSLRMS